MVQLSRTNNISLSGDQTSVDASQLAESVKTGNDINRNVRVGSKAMDKYDNSVIGKNVSIGFENQFFNSNGIQNVSIGNECLKGIELYNGSNFNVAIGYQCGENIGDNSINNVLIGYKCSKASLSNKFIGDNNTYIGFQCGLVNTSGSENVGIGTNCLDSNTSGSQNVAIGKECLQSNVTGSFNVSMGYQSLHSNTASNNTAIGYKCSYFNSSGQYNTAIGYKCLEGETNVYTGTNNNVAIGFQCGQFIGDGANSNVLIGYECGKAATGSGEFIGDNNTYIGFQCGLLSTVANSNVAIGYQCLKNSTDSQNSVIIGRDCFNGFTTDPRPNYTGSQLNSSFQGLKSRQNVFIGVECSQFYVRNKFEGFSNVHNVVIGYRAAKFVNYMTNSVIIGDHAGGGFNEANSGGDSTPHSNVGMDNVAIGGGALGTGKNANNNTCIGHSAGVGIREGDNNVAIGDKAMQTGGNANLSNCIIIGKGINASVSNQIKIGSTISCINGQSWSPTSNNSIDLGTTTHAWRNAYISGKIIAPLHIYKDDDTDNNLTEILRLQRHSNDINNITQAEGGYISMHTTDDNSGLGEGARISWRAENNPDTGEDDVQLGFWTLDDDTLTEKMTITATGNVGIGVTNPTEKLDINGNLHIEGDYICIRSDSNNDGNTGKPALYFSEDNYDSSDSTTHNDSGNVRIIYDGDGQSDDNNFIAIQGRTAANQFNTTLLHCTMGGNVGIGTTSPTEKLEIDGNVKTNGVILGNSTSTTNGTLQWNGTKLQLYYNNGWNNISLDPPELYSFNTFSFTNCGKTGRYGPSRTDCINTYGTGSYWWNNTSYFNVNVDGFQEWTVPSSGTYKIEAGGAKGGSSHSNSLGGNGAKVITYFTLTKSEVIKIIVGQQGTNGNTSSSGSGGGGGTYVLKSPYNTTASVIVVGGGGGGGTSTHYNVAGGNGGTVQSITTSGGTVVGLYSAGAGAGFDNDGAGLYSGSNFTGGRNINNSTYSGHGGSNRVESGWNFVGPGGFGGGGGNGAHDSGGGGGYNGGNSGRAPHNPKTASTGGGSYIHTSGSSSSFTTHTGSHGYVTITKQ